MQMSVETETVLNVSQVQIPSSCDRKASLETLKTKKNAQKKKKISLPNVMTSKAAMFAARVASAVDQDPNDEESENFVYENLIPTNDDELHSPSASIHSFQTYNLPLEMLPTINHVPYYGSAGTNALNGGPLSNSRKLIPKRSAKFSSMVGSSDTRCNSPTTARGLATSPLQINPTTSKSPLLNKKLSSTSQEPFRTSRRSGQESGDVTTKMLRNLLHKRLWISFFFACFVVLSLVYFHYAVQPLL